MAKSIFDNARDLLKNFQSNAGEIASAAINPAGYLGQKVGQYIAPRVAPQIKSVAQSFGQAVSNQPLISVPGVIGLPYKLPAPSLGQYAQGQVIQPIKQGIQGLKQPGVANKGMGGLQTAQGIFSATPVGTMFNIGVGAGAGVGRAFRTGQPLNRSIQNAIATPTSFAQEGLGINNPFIAGAIDFSLGFNPKTTITTVGNIKNARALSQLVKNTPIHINQEIASKAISNARNLDLNDYNLMKTFAAGIQGSRGAKGQIKNIALDAQRVAEGIFGPQAATWTNQKMAKAFDWYLQVLDRAPGFQKNPIPNLNLVSKFADQPNQGGQGFANPVADKSKIHSIEVPQQSIQTQSLAQTAQSIPTPNQSFSKTVSGDLPNNSNSFNNNISDPVQKIIQALKVAKPLRGKQEALYSAERSKRAAQVAGIGSSVPGEQGYFAQLSQLKGELPKVQFESIRKQLSQSDVDSLFNKVEQANISTFEKITAKTGLAKLLGVEGGAVPTRGELELLNEVFPPEFIQSVLGNRSTMQKIFAGAGEILNVPRSIMSTLDLSAPLRQGVFLIGRPKQFGPAFKSMFKYATSEKAYKGFQESIKTRPTYRLMREANLAITDMGPTLASREEAFMSNLAEKIPVFGFFARASNRAYAGFLNKLRADVFDDLVKNAKSQGIAVEGKTLEDIAKFVNSATGRGDIGVLNRAAPILNGIFFSPRLMMSRLNLLNPQYYVTLDPFVRKEALKSLLTFGATAGTLVGLAKLGGAEVGVDPRSADFGKIKFGNTRYDPYGGFQQYVKLAAQLMTGQIVSTTTGKVITLGEGYKPLTRKDIIMRFFESKEAPIASFITSLLTGQTATGEPVRLSNEIINRLIPMMTQDIYEIAKDKDNIGQSLAMALPGIFGVGSQTYGKTELVTGKNPIGEPTAQIRPTQGLAETLSEKFFGQQPLGSSSGANVDAYFDQLLKMPKEQRLAEVEKIIKTNPELADKLAETAKDRAKGVTIEDKTIKGLGVASGDRAMEVVKKLNKLKTKEEKLELIKRYVEIGIITKEVARQIGILLKKQ